MNETGYVYYSKSPAVDLSGWLTGLGFQPSAAWVYVERLNAIEFLYWSEGFDPTVWEHGRVFDGCREARWTLKEEGQAETWLLTEAPDLAPTGAKRYDAGAPYEIYLWGRHLSKLERTELVQRPEKDQEAWVEARMPRLLTYPMAGTPEFVAARALDYYRADRPVWTRWTGIGPASRLNQEEMNDDDTT